MYTTSLSVDRESMTASRAAVRDHLAAKDNAELRAIAGGSDQPLVRLIARGLLRSRGETDADSSIEEMKETLSGFAPETLQLYANNEQHPVFARVAALELIAEKETPAE